jgi:hypothetical protein
MAQRCTLCRKNVSSVSLETCSVCEEMVCRDCLCTCIVCEATLCQSCCYFCTSCNDPLCPDCAIVDGDEDHPDVLCDECHEEYYDAKSLYHGILHASKGKS